ncbi:SRPBCC domain-containing protein [Cognatishimia sp. WU-CL00825]|uniref:SRPBCC domain-containing protein n=1 Tax=Cognatishimia sp. WU-CL00825 TaxID=3127658 RepID=UPI0031053F76
MSVLLTAGKIGVVALAGLYAAGLMVGPSISTQVEISAPVDAVWRTLTQGDAYPEWNPFVKHLSGDLVVGSHLDVLIQPEGGKAMRFRPEVLAADQNSELRWVGKLGFRGVFDGEHYFLLEETPEGTTVLRHGETFRGLLAYPLLALIRQDTLDGFVRMNQALKQRAERMV